MPRIDGRSTSIIQLQPLESRCLLTSASVNAAHVLTIVGTKNDDTIFVNRLSNGKVSISGVSTQFKTGTGAGQFNKINITTGDSNDRVTISSNVPYTSATISGGNGKDSLTGGKGNDSIIGGDFNDTVDGGGGGADVLSGGAGFDTANYSTRTESLTITLDSSANDGAGGGAEKDNVQAEEVIAGSGHDSLIGSSANDFLAGGAGNDVIRGMGGDDDLIGSTGADKLYGGDGDDFLQAKNQDRDTVNGGTNSDGTRDFDLASVDSVDQPAIGMIPEEDVSEVESFVTDAELNSDTQGTFGPLAAHLAPLSDAGLLYVLGQPNSQGVVTLTLDDADDTILFNNINIVGTPLLAVNVNGVVLTYDPTTTTQFVLNLGGGDDLVRGTDRARVPMLIHAGDGNDSIIGGARIDTILGEGGDDTLIGGAKSDILVGGDGRDVLFGNDGNDILLGGDREDHLYGERGQDLLIGAATVYDRDVATLTDMMKWWLAGDPMSRRIAGIRANFFSDQRNTLAADKGGNLLNGGHDSDWFLSAAGDRLKQSRGEVIETL